MADVKAEPATSATTAKAPQLEGAFCVDRNTMLAIAKSLPDALKVVATAHAEQSAEDGLMQLHIGLDGASHTVPFRHGMRMDQLKEKVLKITGIPMEEQMYVFAHDARLVDPDALVPLDEPLRCLRSAHAAPISKSLTTEEVAASQEEQVAPEMIKESSEESKDDSDSASMMDCKWPLLSSRQRCSWADLTDAEGLVTLENVADDSFLWSLNHSTPDESMACVMHSPEPVQASSLAWCFTERWRLYNQDETQHQFYVAIPEDWRSEFQVVPRIKKACPKLYKDQVMVRLRGRGSGFLEGWRQKESTDPLMLCMSGRNEYSLDDYWDVFYRIAEFLEEDIYASYNSDPRCCASEIHLEDDWVNGGVRLHGQAVSTSCETGEAPQSERMCNGWAREFADAWRAWDEHEKQHQFHIDVPEACRNEFQVVSRIKAACRGIFSQQVMLRCRGRGSGFVEGRHQAESSDPLMVCISGREPYSLDEYWDIFYKFAAFLEDDLYADFNTSLAKQHTPSRKKLKPVHLLHRSVHGGVRKGSRMN